MKSELTGYVVNRTVKYIVASATVSAAATVAAVATYLKATGTSASELFTLTLPFSISPMIRGLPIAAAIGSVLSRVTHRSAAIFILAPRLYLAQSVEQQT